MNAKWYISTLFLLFLYFGAFQEHVVIPNQEVVLEFVDSKINKLDIKNTIIDVKEKLLKVGVSNINIQETKSGALKISFYSDIHIDNIKEALVKENKLILNQESENEENKSSSSDYNIDVYQLNYETDTSNLNDKFVLEIKHTSDRYTTSYTYAFIKSLKLEKGNQLFKTAYKINRNSPFTKDNSSHQEPEVRAGPQHSTILKNVIV